MTEVLRVENLWKSYGDRTVLRGLGPAGDPQRVVDPTCRRATGHSPTPRPPDC